MDRIRHMINETSFLQHKIMTDIAPESIIPHIALEDMGCTFSSKGYRT